jgi:hypothetical protein
VQEAIQHTPVGCTVSVRAIIAAVREEAPYLQETDCELTELVVMAAILGRSVGFDVRE